MSYASALNLLTESECVPHLERELNARLRIINGFKLIYTKSRKKGEKMAKKKIKKAPVIARSKLSFKDREGTVEIRESYRLTRIRLLNIHDFIEVTFKDGRKETFGKSVVRSVTPII